MLRAALLCALLLMVLPAAATAAQPPPGAVRSDNLEYVTRVPGTGAIISANFDRVGDRDVMLASGDWGIKSFDVSDPRHPCQIAYFRVQATDPATNPSSVVWDARWHRGYVYVIDNERGIEVLRLLRGGPRQAGEMATVRAPAPKPDPYAPVAVEDGGSTARCSSTRGPPPRPRASPAS